MNFRWLLILCACLAVSLQAADASLELNLEDDPNYRMEMTAPEGWNLHADKQLINTIHLQDTTSLGHIGGYALISFAKNQPNTFERREKYFSRISEWLVSRYPEAIVANALPPSFPGFPSLTVSRSLAIDTQKEGEDRFGKIILFHTEGHICSLLIVHESLEKADAALEHLAASLRLTKTL